ncbi:MAG: uroporphyrinogen decarboxylase family protein [Clostridia bacterium]|nr:uroporphyrinogen decarboxylase family protein [Clostridia bacterium]MBQ4158619.1 uroporphyrinogen decarboxylase family protein [Clostridia bacterium]
MNSMERLINRIKGEKVDRAANLNILMAFQAKYASVKYRDFILKPEEKVRANLIAHEAFGIDAVTSMSDPFTEAEGFGCAIEYPEDDHPHAVKRVIEDYGDIRKLKVKKPEDARRMSNGVRLMELYKEKVKGEVPIIGWVEGPIAEFADVYDINLALMDLLTEPEWAEDVMDILTEQAIVFAKAQIQAGADIIGIGDAAASLIGPSLYRNMILERERKIVEAVHEAGAMVKLHICGNISPILEDIKTLKCDIVDIDFMVDFQEANRILNGVSAVSGNIDPVRNVMNASPENIKKEIRMLIETTDNTSIISAGCEIPKNTDPALVKAFYEALAEIG